MENHQMPVLSTLPPEFCGKTFRGNIFEYDFSKGCGYLYLTGRLDPAHFPSREVMFHMSALNPQPRDHRDFDNNFKGKPVHCILSSEESGQRFYAQTIQLLRTDTTNELASAASGDSTSSGTSSQNSRNLKPRELKPKFMEQAMNMGFSWFLIREARSCATFETFESFIDTLIALQEANNCGDSDASEQPPAVEMEAVDMKKLRDLRRENYTLKNHLVCKVCMENELKVMVFPCGHMVFCVACSERQPVRICPVCRESVALAFIKKNEPVREIAVKVEETATPEEIAALEKQNTILKSHRLCHRCGQRDRSQYFVPCNHILLCDECTYSTKSCPACDAHIMQKSGHFCPLICPIV